MSEKIVLIDGHSILNRAFYGIPELTNSEGLHTNAVYGFLNILFKILDEEKAQYLAVAFDLKAPTFRHKMYAEYKGTRKAMPEELREQVPVMKEVLSAMGVPLLMKEGYEADDLLGTIAGQAERAGLEVSIVSGDRDLLQLATDKVQIRIPKTKRTGTEIENYYAADVKEKYLVTPTEFVDVKALMGDASDNIPGIPGIGEKTATKIISEFGSIENAHDHLEEIKPNKAKLSLEEHYDLAVLSKTLAKINTESPVTLDLQAAKLTDLYTPEAFTWMKKLEFKNLLSRFHVEAPKDEAADHFELADTREKAEKFLEKAAKAESFGFAWIEEKDKIYGLALSLGDEGTAFLLAEGSFDENGLALDFLRDHLEELLVYGKTAAVLDLKSQLDLFTVPDREKLFDLSIGAYLVNPLKDHYPYEDIAKEYLDQLIPGRAELFGKDPLEKAKENGEVFAKWACYQAYVAAAALEPVLAKLREMEMEHLFRDIEMPLVYTLRDMERAGISVEAEALKTYGDQLAGRIRELETAIYEQAGETFNINSPKQLGVILFEKMQLPGGKKTKTGYSTAADVLEKLAPEHPIVASILEYRTLAKLKSTYADGLAGFIGPDGRIHSTFNQTITATGRISSTEPNLQNIPVRMELGRLIRKVFVPKPGCVFVDADYSQIELRVLAHISGDEQLIEAYKSDADIHRITASKVFHTPFEEVTDLQRRNAKAVNFGIVYGISSFGLSQDLSITRKEAATYIEQYFATYPQVKTFLDKQVEDAKRNGYVTTLYGRRRPIPELKSSNFMQRSFGERVAMNSPIQGTAADIMKLAMIHVWEELHRRKLNSRLSLQIHDELLIETDRAEATEVAELLKDKMKHAAELSVSLEVDLHTGANWYDAK